VVNSKTNTPNKKIDSNKEMLFGSKVSCKTNCETESKDDQYYKPKVSMSPNLRYCQTPSNTVGMSADNKIMITEDLKVLEVEHNTEEKHISEKQSPKFSSRNSGNSVSIKEDSICEYQDSEGAPLAFNSPITQQDDVESPHTLEKEDQNFGNCIEMVENKQKDKCLHPKFEFLTSQLPLHSISEDVNSPYFASSPSNITAYVRRQSTSNKELSEKTVEAKFSSKTLWCDDVNNSKNNGRTTQTFDSMSENFIENANIETLEQKLDRISKKRQNRIQVFENYLEQWEQEKYHTNQEVLKKKKSNPVRVESKYASQPKVKPKVQPRKPVLAKKRPMKTPSIKNVAALRPVLRTPKPVLTSKSKAIK